MKILGVSVTGYFVRNSIHLGSAWKAAQEASRAARSLCASKYTSVLGSSRLCHAPRTSMPFFLNISTSPSRNRLCRSLIRLLLVSTVYIRSSKQREFFAAFIPKSPGILGPHGTAGVAGPRCPLWTANPAAKPTIRTPTRIPERPKPVSTNCFFIDLLLNASAHRAGYGFYPHRKLLEIRLNVGIINGVGFGWRIAGVDACS